jgi:hypothetical protein
MQKKIRVVCENITVADDCRRRIQDVTEERSMGKTMHHKPDDHRKLVKESCHK